MFRRGTHLALILSIGLGVGAVWSQSTTVWNPDFLRKLPRISTAAELDHLLGELANEADPGRPKAGPSGEFLYRIRAFKGGHTPLLIEDAAGNLTKYGVWMQKSANGRHEKLVLVLPSQTDELFNQE